MGMFSSSRRKRYYVSYGRPTTRYVRVEEPDVVYAPVPQGRVATTVRQTCASCGKFRSAKWEAAHPLIPGKGASSGICARCQRDKTSSDERRPRPRHRKNHHHHHSRHCTETTDDSYCTINDRRSPRRYRSDNRDYSRPRASSRDNIRIVIANQPVHRQARASTQSSSSVEPRIIRRTSIVEVPQPVRSRSRARSSSRAHYLDDGTAQYVEDLVRPRYRSKSRSLSRTSYVEELVPKTRHRRRSSTSHVQFVDDFEEPVMVDIPPRRISRRRAVYFDGAASFDDEEQEDRGRSRSPSSHSRSEGEGHTSTDVRLIEEERFSRDSGRDAIEADQVPSRRISHESGQSFTAQDTRQQASQHDERHSEFVEVHYRRSTDPPPHSPDIVYESHPRPVMRTVNPEPSLEFVKKSKNYERNNSSDQSPEYIRASKSYERDHHNSDSKAPEFLRQTLPERDTYPYSERITSERRKPPNKKRRRYRDDSSEDDYPTVTYRHVPARVQSPPSPVSPDTQPDYLSEMLHSSHITPPRQKSSWQRNRGPPSPPDSRSSPRSVRFADRSSYYDDPNNQEWDTPASSNHPHAQEADHSEEEFPDLGEWPTADPDFDINNPTTDLYGNPLSSYSHYPTHDDWNTHPDDANARPLSDAALAYDWMS